MNVASILASKNIMAEQLKKSDVVTLIKQLYFEQGISISMDDQGNILPPQLAEISKQLAIFKEAARAREKSA